MQYRNPNYKTFFLSFCVYSKNEIFTYISFEQTCFYKIVCSAYSFYLQQVIICTRIIAFSYFFKYVKHVKYTMEYYVKKKNRKETIRNDKDHHVITHQCIRAYFNNQNYPFLFPLTVCLPSLSFWLIMRFLLWGGPQLFKRWVPK